MPKGQHDLTAFRLTRHAVERFAERFHVAGEVAEEELRSALERTRRLGTNPTNDAVAYMGLHRSRVLVAIVQGESCLTVLTWPQFEPKAAEFGRPKFPRKRGRWIRRLAEPEEPAADQDTP
jgi:hypothetical protein